MTRRRWIADEFEGDRAAITGSNATHLARVLRARPGQEFDIATADIVRRGCVLTVSAERVEFELAEILSTPVTSNIVLLISIFKFDRMDWLVEKATELGCAQIVPMVARRSEIHWAQAAQKRVERWRRIAHQAAQQSRRVAPPEICDPRPLREALTGQQSRFRVMLAESSDAPGLSEVLTLHGLAKDGIALAVGPEGGWADDEVAIFRELGWNPASLGEHILRTETAAIAALAIAGSEGW